MGGWYIVTKIIKGRPYLYRQRSWREGARVPVKSEYIGPAESGARALPMAEAVAGWGKGELCELTAADLSEREYDAVRWYTGKAHEWMNGRLRADAPLSEDVAETNAALLSALMHPKARLKHDLTLYRRALVAAEAKVGDIIHDVAFMSCSVDFERAKAHDAHLSKTEKEYKRVILKIQAKAGARGYIAPLEMTAYDDEREIIRYGGVFYITSIIENDGELIYNIQDERRYEIK